MSSVDEFLNLTLVQSDFFERLLVNLHYSCLRLSVLSSSAGRGRGEADLEFDGKMETLRERSNEYSYISPLPSLFRTE